MPANVNAGLSLGIVDACRWCRMSTRSGHRGLRGGDLLLSHQMWYPWASTGG
jgi:hypothetical protein